MLTEVLQRALTTFRKKRCSAKNSVPVRLTKTSAAPADACDAELKKPVILFNSSGLRLRPRATQVGGAISYPSPNRWSR